VSPDRLARFFTEEPGGFRVRKELRSLVLFAYHNVIRDPPFSRMDLISCRNLLIYLGSAFQAQVISVFHFALRPRGYLFLGSSETTDGSGDLFVAVDKDAHLFQSRGVSPRPTLTLPEITRRAPAIAAREPARGAELRWAERLSYADLHHQLSVQGCRRS
jgi:two-component system CheB/CheR fusion protein